MKTYRENVSVNCTSMKKVNVPARQCGFFAMGLAATLLAIMGGTSATIVAVQQDRDDGSVAAVQPLDSSPVVASFKPHDMGNE